VTRKQTNQDFAVSPCNAHQSGDCVTEQNCSRLAESRAKDFSGMVQTLPTAGKAFHIYGTMSDIITDLHGPKKPSSSRTYAQRPASFGLNTVLSKPRTMDFSPVFRACR